MFCFIIIEETVSKDNDATEKCNHLVGLDTNRLPISTLNKSFFAISLYSSQRGNSDHCQRGGNWKFAQILHILVNEDSRDFIEEWPFLDALQYDRLELQ